MDKRYIIVPEAMASLSAKACRRSVTGLRLRTCFLIWCISTLSCFVMFTYILITLPEVHEAILIIVFIVTAVASPIMGLLATVLPQYYLIRRRKHAALVQLRSERNREWHRARDEAKDLVGDLKSVNAAWGSLSTTLKGTSAILLTASRAFDAGEYSPFWDAVLDAVRSLDKAILIMNDLKQHSAGYYRRLHNRKHTFPTLPNNVHILMEAIALGEKFKSIFLSGYTLQDCANIWEGRLTRQAVAGSAVSIDGDVRVIDRRVAEAVQSVRQSLSDSIATEVGTYIRSRASRGGV